jgi:predicted alpha/beta superfamily hydrolase
MAKIEKLWRDMLEGVAAYGVASVLLLGPRPRVFNRAAVLSPSVWWDNRSILDMVRQYKAPLRPRIWLDSGTREDHRVIDDLRLLRDALLEKGWVEGDTLHSREIEGAGHNEAAWAARFGDVLKCLF